MGSIHPFSSSWQDYFHYYINLAQGDIFKFCAILKFAQCEPDLEGCKIYETGPRRSNNIRTYCLYMIFGLKLHDSIEMTVMDNDEVKRKIFFFRWASTSVNINREILVLLLMQSDKCIVLSVSLVTALCVSIQSNWKPLSKQGRH